MMSLRSGLLCAPLVHKVEGYSHPGVRIFDIFSWLIIKHLIMTRSITYDWRFFWICFHIINLLHCLFLMRYTLREPDIVVLLIWSVNLCHCWSMDIHPSRFRLCCLRNLLLINRRIFWILRDEIIQDRLLQLLVVEMVGRSEFICRWFVQPRCLLLLSLVHMFISNMTVLIDVSIIPFNLCFVLHNGFTWFLYVKIGFILARLLLCFHVCWYQFAPGLVVWRFWLGSFVSWFRFFTHLVDVWICWTNWLLFYHNQFGNPFL